jgi:hypothetical protein
MNLVLPVEVLEVRLHSLPLDRKPPLHAMKQSHSLDPSLNPLLHQ